MLGSSSGMVVAEIAVQCSHDIVERSASICEDVLNVHHCVGEGTFFGGFL